MPSHLKNVSRELEKCKHPCHNIVLIWTWMNTEKHGLFWRKIIRICEINVNPYPIMVFLQSVN
jgi:hypothetical protein